VKTIPLHGKNAKGRVALIDDGDYDLVRSRRWTVIERPQPNGRMDGPYAITHFSRDGRRTGVYMHALITGWPKTDHRNGDGLDNQRYNLRPATTAQNNHNQRPRIGTSSRFKGVTWHKKVAKWQATIKLNQRCVYLGVYTSEEEAALAYNAAALEAYGEYAYLNEVAA
jgi:hypothetical protein